MLRKIYIDNYKSLSNFEWEVGAFSVLLGENGTGKSSILEVIRAIRDLISGQRVYDVFFPNTLTRWQNNNIQRFAIELEHENEVFSYSLSIEFSEDRNKVRILSEKLLLDSHPLLEMKTEEGKCDIQLYRDNFSQGPKFPFDWEQSGVYFVPERNDNTKLSWFKKQISSIVCLKIDPFAIAEECAKEADKLDDNASNFVAWYRNISQEKQGELVTLFSCLSQIFPGFRNLQLEKTGLNSKLLRAAFEDKTLFRFSELSDGQKCLLVLYSLLFLQNDDWKILLLDEPDNFVALREIQPLLLKLNDLVEDGQCQIIMASHSSEVIDLLSAEYGYWTYRDSHQAPTRMKQITDDDTASSLKFSEKVARGWVE